MNSLTNSEKFHVALIKTFLDHQVGFRAIPEPYQKSLIKKGYWCDRWDMLTPKAYKNYDEYMSEAYCGSKKEKMEYEYENRTV